MRSVTQIVAQGLPAAGQCGHAGPAGPVSCGSSWAAEGAGCRHLQREPPTRAAATVHPQGAGLCGARIASRATAWEVRGPTQSGENKPEQRVGRVWGLALRVGPVEGRQTAVSGVALSGVTGCLCCVITSLRDSVSGGPGPGWPWFGVPTLQSTCRPRPATVPPRGLSAQRRSSVLGVAAPPSPRPVVPGGADPVSEVTRRHLSSVGCK